LSRRQSSTTDRQSADAPRAQWHVAAAVAGWVLPGMGHAMIGQRKRGLIIGATIGALWLAGLVIGGVSVIDRADNGAWFVGQALVGPAIVADYIVQAHLKPRARIAGDSDHPVYEPSFGHVKEQGILYTALAGLLNLLAILDVVYREPYHVTSEAAS
jgi:hypothetical protein